MKKIPLSPLIIFCLPVFFLFGNLGCSTNSNPSSDLQTPQKTSSSDAPSPSKSPSTPGEEVAVPTIEEGQHVLPTADGRKMAYHYQAGSKSPVWLVIHGLADDMTKVKDLAELAHKEGYPVLRVDLQGHGETLKEYFRSHSKLPEKLNYKDNVIDIQTILLKLKITEVTIVGHSYGGAIAFAVAADLKSSGSARVQSLHMLAPYVQRIDKYMRQTYSPTSIFPPSGSASDDASDAIMDPIMQKFMEQTYRAYIKESFYGSPNPELTKEQDQDVENKVQTAILATKGIRSFDLLDKSKAIPVIDTGLQILGGEKDQLVVPKQLQAFEDRLKAEKIPHKFELLKGDSSTHLFPRLMPQETIKRILQFQKKLSLDN